MEDIWKPRGELKISKPGVGGGSVKSVPLLGIVKDNIDPTRAGRIRVYLGEIGGIDPDNESNWTPVAFMAPYYGWVQPTAGKTGDGTYKQNPASYGMWFSPPDIGTTVVCLFINGDINFGFYIGSIPTPEALRMVPAIGGNFNKESVILNTGEANSYGGAETLPVTNMNTNNSSSTESSSFLTAPKPVHSYVAGIMFQQGILRDPIRGPITSSAQREAPSRVGWGVSTPGRPIYEGGLNDSSVVDAIKQNNAKSLKVVSRRGGHSIVMDDGDVVGNDQLIRIRTALGHQITMSDNGQTLMILHSNGQSYIELGKEGTIDLYSTNSVNVRTQGDLNLHADNNINIHAKKTLNVMAESINIESEKNFNHKVGADSSVYTVGAHKHKVDGTLSMNSSGESSFASASTTYINGSRINLNTGESSAKPEVVPPIPIIAHTDTLFDQTKGFAAAPGKLLSVTSRAPAHAPWANAGQGVNVKVNLGASSQLPSAPSAAVAGVNNAVSSSPVDAVATMTTTATVPSVPAVSTALGPNTTAAAISAQAVSAATGATASAVAQGAAIVNEGSKAVASLGQLALSPSQLDGVVLKPGSSVLADKLIQSGASLEKALPSNLFAGAPGAETLTSFINNTKAQVDTAVSSLQKAQTALTASGVITGKEDGSQVTGLILSASTAGLTNTVNAMKTQLTSGISSAVGSVASSVNSAVTGITGSVASAIKTGNMAANLAQTAMGGLGSVAGAVNTLQSNAKNLAGLVSSVQGVAASAFNAITASFTPFKANVPQNLSAIFKEAQAKANTISNSVTNLAGVGSQLAGAAGQLTGGVSSSLSSIKTATATLTSIGQSVTSVSSAASGLNNLPGGAKAVSNIINSSTAALNSIPGTKEITGILNNASSAINNGLSLSASIESAATKGVSSVLGAAAGSINSGLTGAVSSLTGAVSSLTGAASGLASLSGNVTGALDKLKSGSDSLASLAKSGLPAGAAAELSAAINAIASGGPASIKLPTIGISTVDRSEITGSITSVFGDSSIPLPNFSGASSSDALLESIEEQSSVIASRIADIELVSKQSKAAFSEFNRLELTLPKGDPAILAAKNNWLSLVDKLYALTKAIT